jgi:hypothetical protein
MQKDVNESEDAETKKQKQAPKGEKEGLTISRCENESEEKGYSPRRRCYAPDPCGGVVREEILMVTKDGLSD